MFVTIRTRLALPSATDSRPDNRSAVTEYGTYDDSRLQHAKTVLKDIPDAVDACREMHPDAKKFRVNMPIRPFTGTQCSECGLYLTDWHPVKSVLWMALFGWWWQEQKRNSAFAAVSPRTEVSK